MTGNERSFRLPPQEHDACPPWDLKDYHEMAHVYVPFSCRRCRHTYLAPTFIAKDVIVKHNRTCAQNMSRLAQMILAKAVHIEYIQP